MRVALFGGTGFVGSYLVDALLNAGLQPVLLVRPGSEHRVRHRERCEIVSGSVSDLGAVTSTLSEADAAIYNIGILREFPARGVTFEELHYKAPRRIADACEQLGIGRFVLMSANGVKADGTEYQRSKYRAEQHLQGSGLDWTIFRPSVVFGDPRGRMELATQLLRDIVASPLPAPLFYPGLNRAAAGAFRLSPVHVEDVAQAVVNALLRPLDSRRVISLGGATTLSWREILQTIAAVVGKRKRMVAVPAFGVSTAAALLERFEAFPLTREQLRMLLEGNTCSNAELITQGIQPRPFDAGNLGYLVQALKAHQAGQARAA